MAKPILKLFLSSGSPSF